MRTSSRVRRTKKVEGSTPRREPGAVGVVEDDEVDIARIVQLVRAELSHGEDEISLHLRAFELAAGMRLTEEVR